MSKYGLVVFMAEERFNDGQPTYRNNYGKLYYRIFLEDMKIFFRNLQFLNFLEKSFKGHL